MDMRKLRDHPKSEVAQFKKDVKSVRPFLVILGIILCTVCMGFGLQKIYELKQKEKEPIKVFNTIENPRQQVITSKKQSVSESTQVTTETDSSSRMPMSTVPTEDTSDEENGTKDLEFETSTSTTQNVSEDSELSGQGSASQKDDANEEAGKLAEHLKEKKAEIDQIFREGEQISDQARSTMNQAAPILASHLNTLSREKQIEFLNQVRIQMNSQSLPEVQQLMDNDPELKEKAWQVFLDLLRENGFDPPN